MLFGINEFAIHHEDLAAARGDSYRPPEDVVRALLPAWGASTSEQPSPGADEWEWILKSSGR